MLFPPLFFVIWCLIVFVDPFSTGRYTPIRRADFATKDVLFGHSSRIRDTYFDAAVAGNSHGIVLNPERLTAALQQHFAQLSSLGLNPNEILSLATAFVGARKGTAPSLVIVLDETWCAAGVSNARIRGFFPLFLFESSSIEYLSNLMSWRAVDATAYRLLMLVGLTADRQRRDGYAPISFSDGGWTAEQLASFERLPRPTTAVDAGSPVPALGQLNDFTKKLDPATKLVLFFSPQPYFKLPFPESAADTELKACKNAFRSLVERRQNTILIDRLLDDSFAHEMTNFGDITHVHNRSAMNLERDIISTFTALAR